MNKYVTIANPVNGMNVFSQKNKTYLDQYMFSLLILKMQNVFKKKCTYCMSQCKYCIKTNFNCIANTNIHDAKTLCKFSKVTQTAKNRIENNIAIIALTL